MTSTFWLILHLTSYFYQKMIRNHYNILFLHISMLDKQTTVFQCSQTWFSTTKYEGRRLKTAWVWSLSTSLINMKVMLKLNSNKLNMSEIWLRAQVGRPTSILFKGQLSHKSPPLSKDVFYETGSDRYFSPFALVRHRAVGEGGRDPAIHSTAMLNQKNRASAFGGLRCWAPIME